MKLKNLLREIDRRIRSRIWASKNETIHRDINGGIKSGLKIAVITHDDNALPPVFECRELYFPLRVGNKTNQTIRTDCYVDDDGENISELNTLINEMTGIYWVAHHYKEIGDPPYIGFNHYRRHLQWNSSLLKKGMFIATSGVYVRNLRYYNKIKGDADTEFNHCPPGGVSRRTAMWRILDSEFYKVFDGTEYVEDYEQYWDSHTIYYSNLFITDKNTFFKYYEFLERCISMVRDMIKKNAIDLSGLNNYYRRAYSFFLEHMTSFWIFHAKRNNTIQLKLTNIDYFNIPNLITSNH